MLNALINAFQDDFWRMLAAGGGALQQDKKTVVRRRKRPSHTVGLKVKVEPRRSQPPWMNWTSQYNQSPKKK
jgi:hypothetical protein